MQTVVGELWRDEVLGNLDAVMKVAHLVTRTCWHKHRVPCTTQPSVYQLGNGQSKVRDPALDSFRCPGCEQDMKVSGRLFSTYSICTTVKALSSVKRPKIGHCCEYF